VSENLGRNTDIRVLAKAEKFGTCSEEYTGKTCEVCGEIKHNLGGAKTFTCSNCHTRCDRDANGARNVLIKFATEENVVIYNK
jgi:transposase